MISVDEHLEAVLAAVPTLPPFDQPLLEAQGCPLGADISCPIDLPTFDNSAMDGYAVRAADVAAASEASPVQLPVVGDIAAGSKKAYALGDRLAVRIMTGAPVPHGADAIVPVEDTDGGTAHVSITRPAPVGAHIRPRGDDASAGDLLVSAGTVLMPRHISALAAAGYERVPAHPRPRVVVLSTGSELQAPGTHLAEAMVYDANSYALAAAAREVGAIAYRVGIVPDDPRQLLDLLEDQLIRADAVVTSGGVSAGAYDVVKEVLSRLGSVRFTQVAMQPGKPQGFGTIGDDRTPIFTLPGNPVSSFVSFEVFVRPALRKMFGLTGDDRPHVKAVATQAWTSPPGRRQFTRAHYEPPAPGSPDGLGRVTPAGGQGSHLVTNLAMANALVVVPEAASQVPVGARVNTILLDGERPPLGH
jgi:molybdopterin molybdotransferase